MREKLTKAVDAKWESRLQNWSLWFTGGRQAIFANSTYERLDKRDTSAPREGARTYESTPVPALVGEALDTNHLVFALPLELTRAVSAWYTWTGSPTVWADELGVHVNTLRNRVDTAKVELERMDGQQKRGEKIVPRAHPVSAIS